jgi:hypothetical protein
VDGDLLPDEIDQQHLTAQAIEHVAKLITDGRPSAVAETVEWLERCMGGHTEANFSDGPPSSTSSSYLDSALDLSHPTQPTRVGENLSLRRRGEEMQINMQNTGHSRPFSFFAGDDTALTTRSAPPQNISVCTAEFSPTLPISRSQSMIPSPVADHLLARPRREDSGSSLITSFQRSPCSGSALLRTTSGASSHMSVLTAVRQSSGGIRLVEGLNNAVDKSGSRCADEKSPPMSENGEDHVQSGG